MWFPGLFLRGLLGPRLSVQIGWLQGTGLWDSMAVVAGESDIRGMRILGAGAEEREGSLRHCKGVFRLRQILPKH